MCWWCLCHSAQCTGNRDDIFVIVSKAGEPVIFTCPLGGLSPGDGSIVYSTADCPDHSGLDAVIPGAKITRDQSKNPVECRLSVPELPAGPIDKLCLKKCFLADVSRECEIITYLAAKTKSGESEQTGNTIPGGTPGKPGDTAITSTATQKRDASVLPRPASGYSFLCLFTIVLVSSSRSI